MTLKNEMFTSQVVASLVHGALSILLQVLEGLSIIMLHLSVSSVDPMEHRLYNSLNLTVYR